MNVVHIFTCTFVISLFQLNQILTLILHCWQSLGKLSSHWVKEIVKWQLHMLYLTHKKVNQISSIKFFIVDVTLNPHVNYVKFSNSDFCPQLVALTVMPSTRDLSRNYSFKLIVKLIALNVDGGTGVIQNFYPATTAEGTMTNNLITM